MFQITKYLQYRKTPNGNPKVLVEGVDYNFKNEFSLLQAKKYTFKTSVETLEQIELPELLKIANISDCRPLLSVEIDGEVWTEGDIICKSTMNGEFYGIFYYNKEGTNFMFDFGKYALSIFDLNVEYFRHFEQYSFFDDPAKYSKLLWNCDKEEGWKKVLELLEIKL
jgi:hypothetical protein